MLLVSATYPVTFTVIPLPVIFHEVPAEVQARPNEIFSCLTTVQEDEKPKSILLNDIDEMSQEEREKLLNKLLDKGPDRLSPYDKKILEKLAIS